MIAQILASFPSIDRSGFELSSPSDRKYNCIAWAAAQDTTRFWQPFPGYYWPAAERSDSRAALQMVFEGLGFELCGSPELEQRFEKVALYALGNSWKHAARQLPTGRWISKLGESVDVIHATPECLEGQIYGSVYCFMRRPTPSPGADS